MGKRKSIIPIPELSVEGGDWREKKWIKIIKILSNYGNYINISPHKHGDLSKRTPILPDTNILERPAPPEKRKREDRGSLADGRSRKQEPTKQMGTHAHGGRGAILIHNELFENRLHEEGSWTTKGGLQLQQRYDKSRRPDPGRPSPQRRHKNIGFPNRGNTPLPLPQQEAGARVW